MPTLLKAVYAALEGADLIGPNADLENEIAAALEEWEDEPSLASRLAGGFTGAERERGREAALVRKHLPLANDMITMLHDDLTTIADRANLLSPGNYSVIVLLDDQTWEQPTYRVREPMSEQELKAHAELNCRGFMSFAPQRDDDCPPDQVREIHSAPPPSPSRSTITLTDQTGGDEAVDCTIAESSGQLVIAVEGFGNANGPALAAVELWGGHPRVLVWPDYFDGDPVVIDCCKARNSKETP